MFRLTVRDHMMIAHSLPDPFFGPAAALHGATYVVEATVRSPVLDDHGVVMDIGAAAAALAKITADLGYRNLDDHPAFVGILSTTEVLSRYVAQQMGVALRALDGTRHVTSIEVVLREHPDAWAGYTLALDGPRIQDSPSTNDSTPGG